VFRGWSYDYLTWAKQSEGCRKLKEQTPGVEKNIKIMTSKETDNITNITESKPSVVEYF
jgi:hypothetical protein